MRLALAALLVVLVGCASNPNVTRAQLSQTILAISEEVDRRERLNLMTSAEEVKVQKSLSKLNGYLKSDADLPVECLKRDRVECVDFLLEEFEREYLADERK